MKTNYQYSSPFNYLSPYEKEDKQIFFGRTDEVDEIFNLYKTTNLVILYGKSGTGKTSLAQCGLANKFNDWKSITIRRKNDFVESFFESLINLFGEDFKNQLKNLFNEIITNSQSEKEGELNQEKLDRFDALLNEKKETVSYIPFFIFDQFEELFIEGNKNETKNFSLLLSLITKNVTFSNNLICIQSEFFSDLLVFEKYYNPNILDFKYFIKDPHVDNTREILLKTFKHFGINQVRIDDSKPTEEIHQNIQNERINKIIEFLKESNRVYLPFLQIYLDKLYVEDFIRTYPDHGELLLNPKAIIFKEKPLEFTDKEIDDHGNIEKILTDYIQEINDALIEKENNIYGNEHRDTVIKFLKYFVSEQNTKKTIPIIPKREYNLYTKINDKELQNQIAKKIWKNIPLELEQSIGDIIDELLKARILKQKGNFIELSHNLLAKIISEIYVDEHIQEYYKKHFESSFQTYKKQKNEGVKKSFLNPSLVRQIEDDIDLIIGDDPNKKEKLDFWRLSKKRVENKIYINLLVIFSVIITVVFFASLNFIKEFAYNDLNEKNESLEEMKNQFLNDKNGLQGEKERRQDISRDIYFTAKNNNEDPTKKYKDFSKIISKINDDDSLIPTKDFPLLFIQYNELLLNYTKTPFYIDITSDLTESASKISIKKVNNNTYYVIIKTKNRLFSKTINLQNRDISNWISELDEEVSEYSTYDESKINKNNNKLKENSKQTIIYSNSDGLHKKELNVKKAKQIGPKLKDLSILTHLRNNIFIGLSKNKKIIYKIDGIKGGYDYEEINKFTFGNSSKTNTGTFNFINTIDSVNPEELNSVFFIANVNNIKPYLVKLEVPFNGLDTHYKENDTLNLSSIKSNLKLKDIKGICANKNTIFLALNHLVYRVDLLNLNHVSKYNSPLISVNQETKISCIISKGNNLAIGNDNGRVKIYDISNPDSISLKKELIGHTKSINSISWLENENLIVTSSEDGTVKIWDVAPIEKSLSKSESESIIYGKENNIHFNNEITAIIEDKVVLLFQKKDSIQIPSIIRHNYPIKSLAFHKTEPIIYTRDSKGIQKKWYWKNFKEEIDKRTFKKQE